MLFLKRLQTLNSLNDNRKLKEASLRRKKQAASTRMRSHEELWKNSTLKSGHNAWIAILNSSLYSRKRHHPSGEDMFSVRFSSVQCVQKTYMRHKRVSFMTTFLYSLLLQEIDYFTSSGICYPDLIRVVISIHHWIPIHCISKQSVSCRENEITVFLATEKDRIVIPETSLQRINAFIFSAASLSTGLHSRSFLSLTVECKSRRKKTQLKPCIFQNSKV